MRCRARLAMITARANSSGPNARRCCRNTPVFPQQKIEDAEIAGENPVPDGADNEARHDPGDEEEAAQPRAPGNDPEEQRETEAYEELSGDRGRSRMGRVRRMARFRGERKGHIILEAHERRRVKLRG